ncbi:MAG TPA: amino acid adenylation domain-containing protein, partial [Ktedonobacteraceae bacterium]|nr:amino acid adenylation domain-containing protein [Ktedonobacteraceae bacterium]
MHTDGNELTKRFQYISVRDTSTSVGKKHAADRPTLTEFEQRQLAAWNATRQDYPQDACVPQLVARQAITTPDALAIVAGDQALSYRELNLRANRLAHYLQALGVKPDMLVGLCIERSLDMVVGLLGILKAGGAYVPLDPTYPSERLAFIVEDARTPIMVTQQRLAEKLAVQGTQVVCLDADEAVLAQQSEIEPTCASTVNDLAYVIYTSGSTGHPKGVQITHTSLLNLLFWHQQAFAVTDSDRATQVTSPAFDATGWELWPYLTCGASVYLPDEDTRVSPLLLRDWLLSRKITITFLPTLLAESMMTLEWPTTTVLRFLLTGADTLHHYPPATLPFAVINNYGPTEATVVATYGPVSPTARAEMLPSIGRPIANTCIYILDEMWQQVPIGVPGELYIGGSGVARGYLNRPELTAEKFIPDPFSDEPDARLYKTGDLARILPDGQIAFMGRTDHQVKIRGYRIELDEIASVLNSHPAIQTSIVLAREDTLGDKRLVAYIVPTPEGHVTVGSLRETLLAQLPDYMLPTSFVHLEGLPLTPHGKVDRAALPLPDETNTLRHKATATPDTATEKQVERIVASLLQVEEVGVEDNFFLLGGHSMLGAQLVVQVANTFGVDLSLRTLFEAPTVRQLSAEIERL